MSETEAEWRDGRLVDPSVTPNLCIHNVGLTPGLWCGACNTHPEHPDLALLHAPAPASDSGDPCPKHRARGVNPDCGDCDHAAPAGDSGGERDVRH